ncbi:hypothetical protein FGO68_gene16376 [Halteria grandinella]|uniref:Uncharacterized protein n=1 Tax=Halteria grandinella TaxID=5974 RepID=A0A8J8NE91_HALGN|nr:hypothetical protein FGO68_gene16376 [Halteria grandinella]
MILILIPFGTFTNYILKYFKFNDVKLTSIIQTLVQKNIQGKLINYLLLFGKNCRKTLLVINYIQGNAINLRILIFYTSI